MSVSIVGHKNSVCITILTYMLPQLSCSGITDILRLYTLELVLLNGVKMDNKVQQFKQYNVARQSLCCLETLYESITNVFSIFYLVLGCTTVLIRLLNSFWLVGVLGFCKLPVETLHCIGKAMVGKQAMWSFMKTHYDGKEP